MSILDTSKAKRDGIKVLRTFAPNSDYTCNAGALDFGCRYAFREGWLNPATMKTTPLGRAKLSEI